MTIQSNIVKFAAPVLLFTLPAALVAQQAAPGNPIAETPPPSEAAATPAPAETPPAPAAAEAAPAAPTPEKAPEAAAAPAGEPIATAAPAPQAQASYPPCSATLTDQCTSVTKRSGAKKVARRNKRN